MYPRLAPGGLPHAGLQSSKTGTGGLVPIRSAVVSDGAGGARRTSGIGGYGDGLSGRYCDPPYYDAEDCYAVGFPKEDHQRLHDALLECQGFVMVSYNYCPFIVDLYKEFYIWIASRC